MKLLTKYTIKPLTLTKKTTHGINNQGRITSWHRGGKKYHQLYRIIDFKHTLFNIPAIIRHIEYDPNRNTFIAAICYVNGILAYILAFKKIYIGSIIIIENILKKKYSIGTRNLLQHYKKGISIFNFYKGLKNTTIFNRAAGTTTIILKQRSLLYSILKLPSKEERYIKTTNTIATVGQTLPNHWFYKNKLKAGRIRNKNKRPIVRGVAMNPIDHPHGGGEGRRKGRISSSPWGWLTKIKHKFNPKKFIIKRRTKA